MSHIENDLRFGKCYGCSFSRLNYNVLSCTYHWGESIILNDEQINWYNLELFKKYRRYTPNQNKITCDINTKQLNTIFCWMIDREQNKIRNYLEKIREMDNIILNKDNEIEDKDKKIEELEKRVKEKDNIISAYSTVLKEEIK